MNYHREWAAIKNALSYTDNVTESDIMHAVDSSNIKTMVAVFTREGKIRRNQDGTYSHAGATTDTFVNTK